MKWFKHMTDSLDDPFIQELLDHFSHMGYIAYFGLIETIAKENKSVIDGRLKIQPQFLKRKFRISTSKLEEIFIFCQSKDKLFFSIVEENLLKQKRFSKVFWEFYLPKIAEIKDNYSAHGSGFKEITKTIRERIRRRDKDICQYCKKHCQNSDLIIDHIISYDKTQDSSDNNLVVACRSCNSIKRDRTPEEAGFKNFEHPSKKLSIEEEVEEEVEEEKEVEGDKKKKRTKDLSKRTALTDEEFIQALKINPAYQGVDIDNELARMDAWFLTPKGQGRKKTHKFILGWLNRAERVVDTGPQRQPKTGMDKTIESLQKFLDNEAKNETDDFFALPDRIR